MAPAAARALLNLGDALASIDPSAAADAARSALAHCRRIGNRYALGFATANLVQALLMIGGWDEARRVHAIAITQDELADATPVAADRCAVVRVVGRAGQARRRHGHREVLGAE